MGARTDSEPSERRETLRQGMVRELEQEELSALELGQRLGLREREVVPHLDHLRLSLARKRQRLLVVPSECLDCGFVFESRTRLTRPSACPKCRQSRVEPPRFRVVAE